MKFLVRSFGAVAIAAAAASCGGGGGADAVVAPAGGGGGGGGGGTQTCTGGDFCMNAATFSPTTLTVTRGATVTWVNNSGVTHNVTFDTPGPVTGGNIAEFSSGSRTRTFPSAGSYHFICSIHGPTMSGTLTVP